MEHGETARRASRARQEKNSQQAADSRQLAAFSTKDWAPKCKEVEVQKSWGRYFDVPVFQYWVISFCLLAPISCLLEPVRFQRVKRLERFEQRTTDNELLTSKTMA
jgi:hypothetical protein